MSTDELRAQTETWVGGQAEYWKQRARKAEAAKERTRALALQWISQMPENVAESAVRVVLAEAGNQVLAALDGSS